MVCGWVGALVVGLGYFDLWYGGRGSERDSLGSWARMAFWAWGWDLGSQYGVLGKLI